MSRESPSMDDIYGCGAEAGEAEAFYAEDHPIKYKGILIMRWLGNLLCKIGFHWEREDTESEIANRGWFYRCTRRGCKHSRIEWTNP